MEKIMVTIKNTVTGKSKNIELPMLKSELVKVRNEVLGLNEIGYLNPLHNLKFSVVNNQNIKDVFSLNEQLKDDSLKPINSMFITYMFDMILLINEDIFSNRPKDRFLYQNVFLKYLKTLEEINKGTKEYEFAKFYWLKTFLNGPDYENLKKNEIEEILSKYFMRFGYNIQSIPPVIEDSLNLLDDENELNRIYELGEKMLCTYWRPDIFEV